MAAGAVRPHRLTALLALGVLSCLHLALPAAPSPLLAQAAAAGGGEEPGSGAAVVRGTCTYTVQIKTSCSSPRSSPDAVSLAFGDAYRNEVYAARVSPRRGFERCATDTFKVSGPCGYGVCYLYLRRTGRVGWTPEWVRVYEPTTSGTPSTFYFGDPLPNGVWYGTNRCVRLAGAGAGAGHGAAAAAARAL
ncbi:hypothetical protein BS78_03G046800 [Paspalum vaginatum]|nr:hypothetical protein BS78_03G046800 [Paspalum vaginatum]